MRFHGEYTITDKLPARQRFGFRVAFSMLVFAALPMQAATRTSADYSVTSEIVDAGGAQISSASYSAVAEAGSVGQVVTGGGPTVVKGGFVGQLYNLNGLALSMAGSSIDERGAAQISLIRLLDDGTFLTLSGSAAMWSVVNGAISGISPDGLATAATVYQNTASTVRASYGGQSATLNLTVANVNHDDYGAYANDGVDDYLEVNHLVGAPKVTTPVVSLITQRSAHAVATINPNGLATQAHFEYGYLTPHGISTLPVSLGSGSATLSVAVDLPGLLPHRTWRIRAVATNTLGTTPSADAIFRTYPKTDINRDGYPDLVTMKSTTRTTSILYTRAGVQSGVAVAGPTIPSNLTFCGMADFNKDGKPDWLLFDATAHRAYIWYKTATSSFNTTTSWTRTPITTLIPTGYDVITAVDWDGNGQCDLVLYYKTTRRCMIMRLNGLVQYGALVTGPLIPTGFVITAVDDFTGDGRLDCLVWNPTTRQTGIVNGITSATTYGSYALAGQQLMGADAFKSGDAANWVLYNATTNVTTIWTMSGARMVSSATGPKPPTGAKLLNVR